ncbi:MAG: T9SS type A sorting domain-containing protein [Cytophagaceae bacterium]|jgi:subtilase family serine protease|nr:T9SS type A sorting domain-containing protein [Cytophagaceae bacterium]
MKRLIIFVFTMVGIQSFMLKAYSDLTIDSLRSSSSTAELGNSILIHFNLKNIGFVSSGESYTGFYLSTDSVLSSGDVYISSLFSSGVQYESKVAVSNQCLAIPTTIQPGAYYLILKADYDGDAQESNEQNNTKAIPLQIQSGLPKDLSISISASSNQVELGNTISFQFNLNNQGLGNSGAHYTGVFLSLNAQYEYNDIELSRNIFTPAIPGGLSISQQVSVAIPTQLPTGVYHLLVISDINNQITETNESNNLASITITVLPNSGTIDLSILNTSIPNNFERSQLTSIQLTIRNNNVSASPMHELGYYISLDGILDDQDVLIHNHLAPSAPANSNSPMNTNITIPNTFLAGNYFLIVKADYKNKVTESNENNNVFSQAITLKNANYDLWIKNSQLKDTIREVGNRISFDFNVRNSGLQLITQLNLYSYLSEDTILDSRDYSLGHNGISIFYSNQDYLIQANHLISPTITPGKYYVLIHVDYPNYINEFNENNNHHNAGRVTIKPTSNSIDIVPMPVDFNSPNMELGGLFQCFVTIVNQGSSALLVTNTYALYLSKDTLLSAQDILLDTIEYYIDPFSQNSIREQILRIPKGIFPGSYYLLVVADNKQRIPELIETNNLSKRAVQLVVPPHRDLRIIAANSSEAQLSVDQSETYVSTVIQNIGATALGQFIVSYFLSEDTLVNDEVDEYLYSTYVSALEINESITLEEIVGGFISKPTGNYYLIVVADLYNSLNEVNSANNIKYIPIHIEGTSIDLTISSMSVDKASMLVEESNHIDFTVNNSGSSEAEISACRMYLSSDPILQASDILLNDYINAPEILGGSSYTFNNIEFSVPVETQPGNYYLLIVADAYYFNQETNENNNVNFLPITIITKPKSDWIVYSAQINTGNDLMNDTIQFQYTCLNQGNQSSNGYTYAYVYLSQDTGTANLLEDLFLHWEGSSTSAGNSISFTENFTLASFGYDTGDYYLHIFVNPDKFEEEQDYTNNHLVIKIAPGEMVLDTKSEITEAEAWQAFPNPCSDWIQLSALNKVSKGNIQIVNTTGQLIEEIEWNGMEKISVAHLPNGVYRFQQKENPAYSCTVLVQGH